MPILLLALACEPAADPDDTGAAALDTFDTSDTDSGGDTFDTSGGDDTAVAEVFDASEIADIEAALASAIESQNASGAQLAVWMNGRIILQLVSGTKDPDSTEPVDHQTLFQVGSDTKKMTAIAALQQVDAGLLSLDSSPAEVMPAVDLARSPDWNDTATLHDLLSHQGGLYDYTPWVEMPNDADLRSHSETEFAAGEWQMAPPGALWNYSNPNFSLAGLMTESVDSRMWPDVLTQDLFLPLGLQDTFARRSEVEARGNYAVGTGYSVAAVDRFDPFAGSEFTFGRLAIEDTIDNAFLRPAGLVWSTATDMATFGGFFVQGDPSVLSDELRTTLTEPHVRLYPSLSSQHYGYGWFLLDGFNIRRNYYATPLYLHGGNTLSFTSAQWVLPELGVSISVLSNGYGDDFEGAVVQVVKSLNDFPEPSDAEAVPSEETEAVLLAGTYDDPLVGTFTVSSGEAGLQISMPGLEAMGISVDPALAYSGLTDVYYATIGGTPYDLTFVSDTNGVYQWVRNRLFVGSRVESEAFTAVPPDPARFWPHYLQARVERSTLRFVAIGE